MTEHFSASNEFYQSRDVQSSRNVENAIWNQFVRVSTVQEIANWWPKTFISLNLNKLWVENERTLLATNTKTSNDGFNLNQHQFGRTICQLWSNQFEKKIFQWINQWQQISGQKLVIIRMQHISHDERNIFKRIDFVLRTRLRISIIQTGQFGVIDVCYNWAQ